MRKLLACFLTCLLVLVLWGCSGKGEGEKGEYYLYYLNKEMNQLVREAYEPQGRNAEELCRELSEALKNETEGDDCVELLPEDVSVRNFQLRDGILNLNMSAAYKEMNKSREILVRAGLVRTFLQIDGISKIRILVNGFPLKDSQNEEIGLLDDDSFVENSGKEINTYENITMSLYFADETGERLVSEQRNIYYSTNVPLERVVIEQLVKGPGQDGHYGVLPSELNILSVTVSEGICYVNFDDSFTVPVMDVDPQVTIYSIVNSLAATCHINRVQFSVNGKSNVVFRDEMNLDQLYEVNSSLILEE